MNILGFILALFVTSGFIVTAINPYFMWKLTESWKATSRPSNLYFLLMRVVGIIGSVIGLFLIFAEIFVK